ncbi:unnamed protein product, partial [Amoebophrya sp. A25]
RTSDCGRPSKEIWVGEVKNVHVEVDEKEHNEEAPRPAAVEVTEWHKAGVELPSARHSFGCCVTQRGVYIFGGLDEQENFQNDVVFVPNQALFTPEAATSCSSGANPSASASQAGVQTLTSSLMSKRCLSPELGEHKCWPLQRACDCMRIARSRGRSARRRSDGMRRGGLSNAIPHLLFRFRSKRNHVRVRYEDRTTGWCRGARWRTAKNTSKVKELKRDRFNRDNPKQSRLQLSVL